LRCFDARALLSTMPMMRPPADSIERMVFASCGRRVFVESTTITTPSASGASRLESATVSTGGESMMTAS
jgi:hypothetical protein